MLTDAIGEEDGELEEDLAPVIDPPRPLLKVAFAFVYASRNPDAYSTREIAYADRQATHFLPVS